jgi:Transglycosylase SLT domain
MISTLLATFLLSSQPSWTKTMSPIELATATVESHLNPRAVGQSEDVGILQITPVMVEEVNRILGRKKYTLADRLDPVKSVEMYRIYQKHYSGKRPKVMPVTEWQARIWNAGPTNYNSKSATKYWAKVKREL